MIPAAIGFEPPTRLRTLLPLYRYAALSPDGRSFLGVGRSLPIHSLFQVPPFCRYISAPELCGFLLLSAYSFKTAPVRLELGVVKASATFVGDSL